MRRCRWLRASAGAPPAPSEYGKDLLHSRLPNPAERCGGGRAFHNVSADILNGDDDVDCDVIVCSDDPAAMQAAMELAAKIPNIRAIDGGSLKMHASSSRSRRC